MSRFVGSEVDRLELGDGDWVDIAQRMSYGMQQKLVAHYIKMSGINRPEIDMEGGNIILLLLNIKDWNLQLNGEKAIINKENIEQLDPVIANKIAEEINQRNQLQKKV